jgi:hypothetical protein
MRINGDWRQCDDGIFRPVIRGEILGGEGRWQAAEFLVDTGADCTVISAPTLVALGLHPTTSSLRLGGLGGACGSVLIETRIRLEHDAGEPVHFNGRFAAVTELEGLDVCVLGRDITGLFAVIVDHPANTVCLLGGHHRYAIEWA